MIEQHYNQVGFKNVNHFLAVNGKKLDINQLLNDKKITIRTYDDIIYNRRQHSGFPSKGCLGCALSHYELWKICLENNLPAIIIAEEDNRMYKLTNKDEQNIVSAISKPNGLFNSVEVSNKYNKIHFYGANFYVLSNSACETLVSEFFPIDIQVDWYIAHMATVGKINLEGYKVSKQADHKSSIQRPFYPENDNTVVYQILLGVVILFCLVYIYKYYRRTKINLL